MRWGLGGSAAVAAAFVMAVADVGCRVPRRVHEPREYPALRIQATTLELQLIDPRPSPTQPGTHILSMPSGFEAALRDKLRAQLAGKGPALRVAVTVAAADEIELVDARGEMTRVLVRFDVEVAIEGGPVLIRAETQSTSDLPREEATLEELTIVLEATAHDAFDRYFASEATLERVNREIARHLQRQPS